ncbi:MAG: hypothetical protein Q7T03_00625 [Deltaproteobacteria bacterium]|nr:hypothetical protein [Deltaproteobacteria bacterium]
MVDFNFSPVAYYLNGPSFAPFEWGAMSALDFGPPETFLPFLPSPMDRGLERLTGGIGNGGWGPVSLSMFGDSPFAQGVDNFQGSDVNGAANIVGGWGDAMIMTNPFNPWQLGSNMYSGDAAPAFNYPFPLPYSPVQSGNQTGQGAGAKAAASPAEAKVAENKEAEDKKPPPSEGGDSKGDEEGAGGPERHAGGRGAPKKAPPPPKPARRAYENPDGTLREGAIDLTAGQKVDAKTTKTTEPPPVVVDKDPVKIELTALTPQEREVLPVGLKREKIYKVSSGSAKGLVLIKNGDVFPMRVSSSGEYSVATQKMGSMKNGKFFPD